MWLEKLSTPFYTVLDLQLKYRPSGYFTTARRATPIHGAKILPSVKPQGRPSSRFAAASAAAATLGGSATVEDTVGGSADHMAGVGVGAGSGG